MCDLQKVLQDLNILQLNNIVFSGPSEFNDFIGTKQEMVDYVIGCKLANEPDFVTKASQFELFDNVCICYEQSSCDGQILEFDFIKNRVEIVFWYGRMGEPESDWFDIDNIFKGKKY